MKFLVILDLECIFGSYCSTMFLNMKLAQSHDVVIQMLQKKSMLVSLQKLVRLFIHDLINLGESRQILPGLTANSFTRGHFSFENVVEKV